MKVILCNDDIGLTYGFTEAIKNSFLKSATSSTSLRTNGTAYAYTVKILKKDLKSIGLGLHLNLVDGKAHTQQLADKKGNYKFNFLQYLLLSRNKSTLKDIENELDFQFRKVINNGLKIDHVSGHRHTYAIPGIFEIVCKLCKKYRIKSIRLLNEPFYLTKSPSKNITPFINFNIFKFLLLNYLSRKDKKIIEKYKLNTTDAFYGVLYTDSMSLDTIEAALADANKRGYKKIEILIHPAYSNDPRDKVYTSPLIKRYVRQRTRRIETQTSLSKKLKNIMSSPEIELSTFKETK